MIKFIRTMGSVLLAGPLFLIIFCARMNAQQLQPAEEAIQSSFVYGNDASAVNTHYQVDAAYVERLVQQADNLGLHLDKYWSILLHYETGACGSKSLVDDPKFFLAPDGKTNPKAELEATIRAFFIPYSEKERHPASRFIARFAWLTKQLSIDKKKIPYDALREYINYRDDLAPEQISLVFPAGYLESPASMFGHSFLIIDRKNVSRLQSLVINYAAITDETNGIIFAYKGLFGLYKGYYSFTPYYQRIRVYNNMEHRDVWEYNFNFTPEEIDRMLMHIIELENIYSYYYFLDENCSFNILYLMEAARPSLDMVSKFKYSCEPIDTIRETLRQDATELTNYRPSVYSKVMYLASKLNAKQQAFVIDTCRKGQAVDEQGLHAVAESEEEKALVLDLSAEYAQYLFTKNKISTEQYRKTYLSSLSARSKLSYDRVPVNEMPLPVSPDKGHLSKMIGFGAGVSDGSPFAELQFRMTNHSLIDNDAGYNRNSQLIFGNLFIRYDREEDKLFLQHFDFVDIDSIPRSDRFAFRNAIFFKAGITRNIVSDQSSDQKLSFYTTAGPGVSVNLLKTDFFVNPLFYLSFGDYDYYSNIELGARAGLINSFGIWKSLICAEARKAPFFNKHDYLRLSLQERFEIVRNVSFIADGSYNYSFGHDYYEVMGKLQYCFF